MFWRDSSPIQKYIWDGLMIDVDLSFDHVLMFLELLQDEDFHVHDRLIIGIELFVDEKIVNKFDRRSRIDFMVSMMQDLLEIDLNDQNHEIDIPAFDFFEDAGRIYSSFLYDYHIDLYEKQGRMSWHDFLQLLENLSEKTQFQQAVMYRTSEVPRKTEHNKDEIKHIKAMKKKYAFTSERMKKLIQKANDLKVLAKMQEHSQRIKGGARKGGE